MTTMVEIHVQEDKVFGFHMTGAAGRVEDGHTPGTISGGTDILTGGVELTVTDQYNPCIVRRHNGPRDRGYILNTGGKGVRVSYAMYDKDRERIVFKGPQTDFILPGQYREIGAAPERVGWVLSEMG